MRAWVRAATLGVALSCASPAFAQKSDDTTMAEAKQRFQEGINFADAGNHEAARLKFNQAWSLLKSPAVLYNLARSEQLSGHPVEALEHYRLFAKMGSDPKVTEQQKQRASENIAQLSEKVGQIAIDAPANAHVTIDGKAVEWNPNSDPIPVLPGKHEVATTVDGKPTSVTVECTPGTVTRAKLVAPAPPPAAPPPATTPAPAPVTVTPVPESGPGFWTTGRAVGAGLAGAGLIGVGVGIVFQLKANSIVDDIDKEKAGLAGNNSYCTAPVAQERADKCHDLSTKADDVKSAETLRSVFLIGGGALLAGGVALFLLSPPGKAADPPRGLRFVPYASGQGMGLATFGEF